ncbi:MAG: endo alpha-1,4 polygalactosaminidase [Hyphomicrobiaceae bacterium]
MTSSFAQGIGWRRKTAVAFGPMLAGWMMLLMVLPAAAETPAGKLHGSAERLAGVKSWGYQLQGVDPAEIAASPYDLIVIDYSRNGQDARRFTPAEVKLMQAKPDGSRRFVIAYMSIGEAEDYRFYWTRGWVEAAPLRQSHNEAETKELPSGFETVRIPKLIAPSWLGRENERWRGNYHVRFWYSGWHDLIMHNQDSYLSRIIAAGFDGVYLDRVDAYYAIERDTESAKEWMVSFVAELASLARQKKSDFIVIPQNAEELLSEQRYLAAIDGVAKEDLLFGADRDGQRNSDGTIARSSKKLALARALGLQVLGVEYLNDPQQIAKASEELRARGIIPYFAPRGLDKLETSTASKESAEEGDDKEKETER